MTAVSIPGIVVLTSSSFVPVSLFLVDYLLSLCESVQKGVRMRGYFWCYDGVNFFNYTKLPKLYTSVEIM